VHSLVLELTGKKEPKDGLEAKFSVYHGCAAGLLFGEAGEGEFDDELVNRADVVAIRRKVVATVDPTIDEAEVHAVAVMRDGTQKAVHVQHAIGSLQRPLTDGDLERKFTSLAAPVLGERSLAPLIASLWALGHAPDVRDVTALAVPAA
jgi:2-methylcitrate dehydratase PrpD